MSTWFCSLKLLLMIFGVSYQATLKQLFSEFGNRDDSNSQLASVTMRIMQALQNNLEGKSKQYRDPASTHLFLMNNIHYIWLDLCAGKFSFAFEEYWSEL